MVKRHIILKQRRAPVQITLPNGRSFTSRCERISRKQLPINIKVARGRNIGPTRKRKRKPIPKITIGRNKQMGWEIRRDRRNAAMDNNVDFQVGKGLGNTLLKTGIDLGSRALGSNIGKKLIDKGIDSIPNIFKFGKSKIKNQNIKKALDSEMADIVGEAQSKVRKKYDRHRTKNNQKLDIEPKTDIFFFDSYRLDGLKHFIVQDDRAIIDKILVGIVKMDRTDNKITLFKIKFNLSACKQLTEDEIVALSDTARQFFYFIQSFGNKLKLRSFINIWMVEDRLQDLESSTCSIFQIYFYKNLFDPGEDSKINGES